MKTFLLPHLICPACLPKEHRLSPTTGHQVDDDILSGYLSCPNCQRRFPIKDGLAFLLPDPDGSLSTGHWRYEEDETVNRYLWSHYSDLHGDNGNTAANSAWAGLVAQSGATALDAGCSVGRVTFEMAGRSGFAVGCDLSHSFIKAARRLATEGKLTYSLPLEGNLRETFHINLPENWYSNKIEFVVADALRLPFAAGIFQQSASLNLLDRISYPLAHLFEMNRVTRERKASFLFASPFSWGASEIPQELWLGGTISGPYSGRGIENVESLLVGKGKVIAPPWEISQRGAVEWTMRSHRNHWETFRSEYLVAVR